MYLPKDVEGLAEPGLAYEWDLNNTCQLVVHLHYPIW